MVQGFAAADGALLTMDASGGVEAGTERAVALGRSTGTAALFVITRCERENADPTAALDALRAAFGNKIAPLHLAIGRADTFRGYVDLVHRKAYEFDKGKRSEIEIPAELADEVARRRDQLLEAAAEADDDVLTKYLEGEEISDEELDACLHRGVRDSILAPVMVTSAAHDIGIDGVLDAIVRYLPSPGEEKPVTAVDGAGKDVEVAPDQSGPLVALVFKTTADPFVGRLTFFRVFSGKIASHDHIWNANRGEEERIGQVLRVKGKDTEPVGVISAGEIGAVAKLVHTHTGETLSTREKPYKLPAARVPAGVAARGDGAADEGRPRQDGRRPQSPRGGGSVRPSRAPGRNRRAAPLGAGRKPRGRDHRAAEAQVRRRSRHSHAAHPIPRDDSLQDAGRGPAQEADRRPRPVRPCLAGDRAQPCGGVEFATKVVGGSVPRQFWAGVEKGVRDVAEKGPIAGYPVIDFKATLYDGSFHTVDSDELSFRLAGQLATRKGIQDSAPVLLEPIMDVEVRVPEEYMGDVNRDLNTRRGRVLGMDSSDGVQVVKAHVPQAELFNYATELRSLSGGRGQFQATLDHYEEVPAHVAQKVIEAHKKDETASH